MSNQRFPGRLPLSRGQNYDNSSYAASAAPRDAPTAPTTTNTLPQMMPISTSRASNTAHTVVKEDLPLAAGVG
jgi:hypothetical protein